MSDTDSFIEEVTDEVRRDRMFVLMKRYGWIAVLAVILLVGGAAYQEWRKAQDLKSAQVLGDALLGALENNDAPTRLGELDKIETTSPAGRAIVAFMAASEEVQTDAPDAAAKRLQAQADNTDLPLIYRQIAAFKALTLQSTTTDIETRRAGFTSLAAPGSALRVLAEEQLALIAVEEGKPDAAIERLQNLIADAEVTAGLRRRASQLIVALGGEIATPAPETGEATQ